MRIDYELGEYILDEGCASSLDHYIGTEPLRIGER